MTNPSRVTTGRWAMLCARFGAALLLACTGFLAVPVHVPDADAASAHEAAYIDQVFRAFLGRSPSATELADARQLSMTDRRGRIRLLTNLTTSREWYTATVFGLYQRILHREPDLRGFVTWVRLLSAGGASLDEAEVVFYASSEYVAGRSTQGWIQGLYRDLLGRSADAGGLSHWLGYAATHSRSSTVKAFAASTEARRRRVAAAYQTHLGRVADPGGLRHWTARESGLGRVRVAIGLAGSSEAYGPMQPGEYVVPTGPVLLPERLAHNGLTRKLITVRSAGWASTTGELTGWERSTVGWKRVFGPWRSHNGTAGWRTEKSRREGDGTTPAGRFGFLGGFGLAPNPGYTLGWFGVGPYDYWAGDASRWDYNTHRIGPANPAHAPWREYEHLIDYPVAYRYAAVIDFNMPVTGPRGSAIFLHVSTGGPTAGCVSLTESRLLQVLPWIGNGTQIVMGPDSVIRSY